MITEHTFCRLLLKEVMKYVRKYVSKEDIKRAYPWKPSSFNGTFEFHGPDAFYWSGQSCCLWHAKVQGWTSYLKKIGIIE